MILSEQENTFYSFIKTNFPNGKNLVGVLLARVVCMCVCMYCLCSVLYWLFVTVVVMFVVVGGGAAVVVVVLVRRGI